MKLSAGVEGYWLDKRLSFSPHTVASYGRVYARLVAYLGDPELASVTPDDIRRFLVYLQTQHKLGRRSTHDAWVALSSLWTWAARELGIPHIVRGKVAAPAYDMDLILQIRFSSPSIRFDAPRLAGYTGLRYAILWRARPLPHHRRLFDCLDHHPN